MIFSFKILFKFIYIIIFLVDGMPSPGSENDSPSNMSNSKYIERKYQIDRKYRPDPAWEREELLNSIDDIYNATRHGKGMVFYN